MNVKNKSCYFLWVLVSLSVVELPSHVKTWTDLIANKLNKKYLCLAEQEHQTQVF